MTSYLLELPFPPSANNLTRHGKGFTYRTKAAIAFADAVSVVCLERGITPLDGAVKLTVWAWLPSSDRDMGNSDKALSDSLNGYAYHDDIQIVSTTYHRFEAASPKRKNAKVIVFVEQVPDLHKLRNEWMDNLGYAKMVCDISTEGL